MKLKKVKPSKEGLLVANPKNNLFLKEEGEVVPVNAYWSRMIKCGDVVEVVEEKKVEVKQFTKKQSKKINNEKTGE